MVAGDAYWYANKTGANRTLVLAGEADTTGVGVPAVLIQSPTGSTAKYTQYSWRDPRFVARDKLNLWTQGFTGGSVINTDKVVEQGGNGSFFYCNTANPPTFISNSTPPLLGATPGVAYYISNKHIGHNWTYTYNASGNPLMAPPSSGFETPTTVPTELLKVTPTVKTKAAARVSHGATN